MAESRLRVLWICGAPGAGKSVAAWGLFERLAAAGSAVAHVDIDQLGMLYPESDDDPHGYTLKSAALDALIPGYAAAVDTLVVSGVLDPTTRPTLVSDVEVTLCLLLPDPAVLRRRLLARGWTPSVVAQAAHDDASLRVASFVDAAISTDGMSIGETVARLEALVDVRPPRAVRAVTGRSPARAEVIVITGPRAVGASTVGFGTAMDAWRAGAKAGFVDLQQLGFVSGRDGRPDMDTALAIGQLATMHRVMADHGAQRLIVSAHLTVTERRALRSAFPSARVTIVRLRADADAFKDHVRSRTKGSAARLVGDDLIGATEAYQALIVERALAEQAILDQFASDDLVLDVSRQTPAEAIARIATSR